MAETFFPLSHANKEVVLTAHFNTLGTRLVAGSADHRLRVFDDKDNEWILIEEWRAHNAEVTEARWHPHPHPAIIASIGEDTRLKIWLEDATAAPLGGRRFNCVYSQSPSQPSPYVALAFHATSPNRAILAVATRNGLLSLLEPEQSASDTPLLSSWPEIDALYICGQSMPRGTETSFRFSFQDAERPIWAAVRSGLDPRAISLAVAALNDVKVYRITPHTGTGSEQRYRFSLPVAELTGATAIVRDVAWSPILYRDKDLIATASADDYIRIYEMEVPKAQPAATTSNTVVKGVNHHSGISEGLAGSERKISAPEDGGIRHQWAEVAKLRHDGCWRVEWMQDGNMLISTGDTGRAHIWAYEKTNHSWAEFADFGPEDGSSSA